MTVGKIVVVDIETLRKQFLYMAYDVQLDEWVYYGVWEGYNTLDKLYKHYEMLRRENYHQVGFNTLSFDAQVMEYILRNIQNWHHKTNEEILSLIYNKSQNIINDNNHGLFPPYREHELFVPQIDLFKIAHYDNENKRTSLKWLEFMMDMPSLESMPIEHNKENLTADERREIIKYCKNDIESTYTFYKYMRGQVEHDFYKGKDKIQDRIDLIDELELPTEFINYSDVKIGDELNKRTYCKLTNKTPKQLYELKRARRPTKKFTFGDAIPEYVKFTTTPFIEFYERIKKDRVRLDNVEQEYKFQYNGTIYTIARGGIHSNESYRTIIPRENEYLRDADVGAQYPQAIKKRGLYPSHLGPKWTEVCNMNIAKKDIYKQAGKNTTDDTVKRKNKSLETMMKYALNGGLFGKTIERTNWQYAPEVGLYCTIGNQFEILMLIEQMEINNIHCISANTDGIVCLFDKELNDKYYEICHIWESIVGNSVEGKLEYQDYSKLVQEGVNSYYAIKPTKKLLKNDKEYWEQPEVKLKGRLNWETELHMNNSKDLSRIERKALHDYFVKDIPVDVTIRNEKNIYMFCIGLKASRNYRFEAISETNDIYTRVLRYIVTIEGKKLLKIKNDDVETNGAKITRMAGGQLVTVVNQIFDDHREYFDSINYDYYISGASEARDMILRGGKKSKPINPNQISLF